MMSMRDKRKETFIEKAKKKHDNKYDYSKVIYVNASTCVIIVCPIHGDFLKRPDCHINGKYEGCKKCSMEKRGKARRSTTEEFIEKANVKHNNIYGYEETVYVLAHEKVKIRCREHGPFYQTPNNHLNGQGCPKCLSDRSLTREEFISNAKAVHGDLYNYDKVIYVNAHTKVDIICKIHGIFQQTPLNHVIGRNGCSKCAGKHHHNNEEYIELAKSIHGDEYDYSKTNYDIMFAEITVTCKVHGDFTITAARHIHGRNGCSKCNSTGYSKCAIKWLNLVARKKGIHIQHAENGGEYKIPGTRYFADGYCEENRTIYEFYGCLFHGCSTCYDPDSENKWLKETYSNLYERTLEREKIIRSLGFNLVVIWEHEWRIIEKTTSNIVSVDAEVIIEDKGKKEIEEVKEKPKRKPIIIVIDSDDEDDFADIIVTEGKDEYEKEDDTPCSSS